MSKQDIICHKVKDLKASQYSGEDLPSDMITDLETHIKTCEDCRTDEEMFALLAQSNSLGSDAPEMSDSSKNKMVDDILFKADPNLGTYKTPEKRFTRTLIFTGSIAALILGGFVTWLIFSSSTKEPSTYKNTLSNDNTCSAYIHSQTGVTSLDGKALSTKTDLLKGSLISTDKGSVKASICGDTSILLNPGSEATIVRKDLDEVKIGLHFGTVTSQVSPNWKGNKFIISTRLGDVIVTGTKFVVSDIDNKVTVLVLRGSVLVAEPGKTSRRVIAGDKTILGVEHSINQDDPTDADNLSAEDEELISKGNIVLSKKVDSKQMGKRLSASTLLQNAQAARSGQNWSEVVKAYNLLILQYPTSHEARSSMVSLGLVQLNKIGNPNSAITSFDKYLKNNKTGSLAQEASWGKVKAYRALGQIANEKSALQLFIGQFPNSIQVETAQKRLAQLNK